MSIQRTYRHAFPYGMSGGRRGGGGTKPFTWFEIINPATGARSRRELGLIDSGCDSCLLDAGILSGTGLVATTGASVTVAGGGSLRVSTMVADIEIEGVPLGGVTLYFGTQATPLIGRQLYLNCFELAFGASDWLQA